METRYPIRRADGTEYQRYEDVRGKLGSEQAGKWLVANNHQWHGGIHISGKNVPHAVLTAETVEPAVPLQCMAGGDIVALRVNAEYKEVPYGEDQKIKYSSTFVLVRSTHTPDSNKPNSALTFYTLYMHLAPLSDYPERNISLVIERSGLKKRTVTNHEVEGQVTADATNGTFPRGTLVEVGRTLSFTHNGASKDFCTVRKIENGKPVGDYFWVAAGEENLQPQSKQRAYLPDWMQEAVRTSTYDSVIIPATTIKISAGSPIGFLGRDDAPNVRDEVQADWQSHIEVFSNDSKMPRFLSNPENLTGNEKGYIKAKEGASISKREDVDNVATFTPTEKTVSKDEIWRVVEPEKSIPGEDAEGKWWFQFDKNVWLRQEDVDELNPYNLIARNFKPLEQPPTDDFSETLVELWVSKAFRWFGSTEPTAEKEHFFWEGSASLIENYTGGSIQKFMFKHLRGLLFDRLNFEDEGIAELRRRLIIKHDSEWYGKSGEPYWKKILDECGDKERPWLTQWRDDVEWMSQVEGFKEKAQRQLWHFHPLEFIHAIKSRSVAIIFPLRVKPENEPGNIWGSIRNWRSGRRTNAATMDYPRDGGRKHAARDLSTKPYTVVVAICPGVVLDVGDFYSSTHQITVHHKTIDGREFIVRYGEVNPTTVKVNRGDLVVQGQQLGETGKLISVRSTGERYNPVILNNKIVFMLHFELFTGSEGFTLQTQLTDKGSAATAYKRRRDLIDPIDLLVEGFNNTFGSQSDLGERKDVATLKTSQKGKQFIKDWEILELRPYNDSHGYCTIGYGHLISKNRCENILIQDEFRDEISQEKADQVFDNDLVKFEVGVRKYITVPLYQHEFDALVSLLFNCGDSFFESGAPNLVSNINSNKYEAAAVEFLDITNGGERGLVKRRNAENNIFLNNIYNSAH